MIAVPESVSGRIRRHAEACYPNECCGALLGRVEDDSRYVVAHFPLDNQRQGEAGRRRFLVTADDYRQTEKEARDRSLDVLGFYHSHPDHPARPSEFDREHALPWFSYIIISVERGFAKDLTSWTLAEDRSHFDPETVVASESEPTPESL
jgi:proteasome lid subunit RPN8/RPN11